MRAALSPNLCAFSRIYSVTVVSGTSTFPKGAV